jgi:hypothetical protein
VIHFVTPRSGAFGIRDFVDLHAPDLANALTVHHYEELPGCRSVPSGTWIFAALDQLTAGGMALVQELAGQLQQPQSESRVLNDPSRVLLRYGLLERLHAEGLNVHRAARAGSRLGDLRYPVFVREEFQHNGAISPLLKDAVDLRNALGVAARRGYQLDELLVVEFVDTQDAVGRYQRYAAFVIDGTIVAKELMSGTEWMLKSPASAPEAADLLAEREWVIGNPHEQELRVIFDVAGVDYGRIDFGLIDGRIETWEINLNPTIRRGRTPDRTPLSAALDALREPTRQHFTRSFVDALRAADPYTSTRAVPVRYSAATVRQAAPMIRPDGRRWHRLVERTLGRVPLLKRALAALRAR